MYRNILFTGENDNTFVRLLEGAPDFYINQDNLCGVVFTKPMNFAYVVGEGRKVSAWIVRNEKGVTTLPYLSQPSLLLLEAPGAFRVKRLVKTLGVLRNAGITLDDLSVDTCLKWDALISRRSYNAYWIMDEIHQS